MKLITHLSWLLRALLFLAVFAFCAHEYRPGDAALLPRADLGDPDDRGLAALFRLRRGIGVLACLSRLLGQRREIQKLERELRSGGDRTLPPQA